MRRLILLTKSGKPVTMKSANNIVENIFGTKKSWDIYSGKSWNNPKYLLDVLNEEEETNVLLLLPNKVYVFVDPDIINRFKIKLANVNKTSWEIGYSFYKQEMKSNKFVGIKGFGPSSN